MGLPGGHSPRHERVAHDERVTTSLRPPGPDLSRLGALRAFRSDPLGLLERLAVYGDVVRIDVPGSAAYLVNHPGLVHGVLVAGHRSFHKGPTIQAAKMLLGESLLTNEDETHLRRRRLIQPMFHHERIATYAASMVRFAERAAERWGDGDEVDIQAEMSALTLAVVGDTLFGTDVDERRSATVRRALTDTLSMFDRVYSPLFRLLVRLPSPMMRRYRRVESDLNRVIAEMIAERRAAGADGNDLLSLLLRADEEGVGLTDEQVRDEALTLFLAGHETTAIALTWTWWLLSRKPEAEARLHAELDAVLSEGGPSVGDLPNLPYTQAVISESIRLRPPVWAIGRTAIAGHPANGYAIDRGSIVVVSPWLLHHDPRWWPEPESFRPERWLHDDPDRPRYAFIPFGGGPRVCIGEPFARLEAAMLLASIARRWRFASPSDGEPDLQAVITLRPRGGLPMLAHRRTPDGA
jgi:cytochrome P450